MLVTGCSRTWALPRCTLKGLMHHIEQQQERCRAEPQELPGQDSDGILPALRRQPVVLVRQIDQGGGDLSEDEPDAGEHDRYENHHDKIELHEMIFARPCVRLTRCTEVRCDAVRKEGIIMGGVPDAKQEKNNEYT